MLVQEEVAAQADEATTEEICRFDAIALDTSVFDGQGLALERGLLAQMAQFKIGRITFLVSDIVLRELRDHLIRPASAALSNLEGAMMDLERSKILEGAGANAIRAAVAGLDTSAAVDQRIQRFLEDTGAIVVPSSLADAGRLADMYFAENQPFATGKKKNEFPDALALLALERWAEENDRHVLAVSTDKGWHEFAKANPNRMTVTGNLANALTRVQEDDDHALAQVLAILRDDANIATSVTNAAIDGMANTPVEPEADSSLYIECAAAAFQPDAAIIADLDEVAIIQLKSESVVVRIPVIITGTVYADYDLSVWDSVDRENVAMGSQHVELSFEENAAVLLTLGRNPEDPRDVEVLGTELIEVSSYVDFGVIEPDWSDDYYDDRT